LVLFYGAVAVVCGKNDGYDGHALAHCKSPTSRSEFVYRPTSVLVLFFGALVHTFLFASDDAPSVPVGAAKIDITPDYPVRLSGYGNRRAESQGVAQRIWAKAVAIGGDAGDGPAVWIAYENCGLTPAIRDEVARQLGEQSRLNSERLVISVTHSHTAPCLTNWAPYIFGSDIPKEQQDRIDRYTRELTEKLIRVGRDALAARRPARLFWAQGKVGFAANRRVLRDGRWTGFGAQPDGPVDHGLPALFAKDDTGKLLACVANYACHCTTLGGAFNQIAGDWAGFAQEYIESDQPGCVAMVTIGCGADANPRLRGDDLDLCRRQGRELADEVKRLFAGELRPLRSAPRCRQVSIELPFEPPHDVDAWKERAKASDAAGYHARQFLARLERGESIPRTLPYPVASWCFDRDLAMVFLGGEVVVDYALRMKTEFDADRLWITAYSNDVPCYIPSRRILAEGGYEADSSMVYYARPRRFAPEVEDLILDAVQKVVSQWFYSAAKQAEFPPPKSPDESLQSIQVPKGFRVELVAAEPLVEDPVAFDWTADGKLWVAEMRDYPNGMAWDKPGDRLGVPGGRIKLLSDTDGDGRYDRASVFLDGVPFPNSVKSWRNGVLVTAAPTIIFAEDTDGDGRADRQESLYEGFGEGNQQHRANGLRWGIDNWLYVANGDSGGRIKSLKTGQTVSRCPSTGGMCGSGPTTDRSRPNPARRNSGAAPTIGATGSAATTRIRSGSTCWTISTCGAILSILLPRFAVTSRRSAALPRCFPLAARWRGSMTTMRPIASLRPAARRSIATKVCSRRQEGRIGVRRRRTRHTCLFANRCTIWFTTR
jgi:hypothetical protein